MVFSNETVAAQINERFVSAWVNKKPEKRFRDGLYDKVPLDTFLKQPVGSGLTNLTSIFATAEGRVLNAVPGYLDAVGFQNEMFFALQVARALKEAEGKSEDELNRLLYAAHRDHTRAHATVSRKQYILRTPADAAHQWMARAGLMTVKEITFDHFDSLEKNGKFSEFT